MHVQFRRIAPLLQQERLDAYLYAGGTRNGKRCSAATVGRAVGSARTGPPGDEPVRVLASVAAVAAMMALVLGVELAAQLAGRKRLAMDVHVRVAGADGGDDLGKLPGCDALGRRPDDVVGGDDAANRASGRRAGGRGGTRWCIADVRAQENADAAAERTLAEVDVRLQHRRRDVAVAQRPFDRIL